MTSPLRPFRSTNGQGLMIILVAIGIIAFLGVAIIQLIFVEGKASVIRAREELTFQIAEGGLYYYKWHLAKDEEDFQDGTAGAGPYLHSYTDDLGETIGQYSLTITAPDPGTTRATITSTGSVEGSSQTAEISSDFCIPTFANYLVATQYELSFTEDETTNGRIHSNEGVRHEGVSTDLVTAGSETYTDDSAGETTQPGVHTVNGDFDSVFLSGAQYPVAPIDFDNISGDYPTLREEAQTNGVYLPPSGSFGYEIVFNGTQYQVYTIITQRGCGWRENTDDPFTSVGKTHEPAIKVQAIIDCGETCPYIPLQDKLVIFAEDDVWVHGTVDGFNVLIVAAEESFTDGTANIYVNKNLTYVAGGESESVGLVAQNDIGIGYYSDDALVIDAAMIAQKGSIGRYDYTVPDGMLYSPAGCNAYIDRSSVDIFGSLASTTQYAFQDADGDGYASHSLTYDPSLTCTPPPYYPQIGPYALFSTTRESTTD